MRLMIVDDGKLNLEFASTTLIEHKLFKEDEIVLACSGEEALDILDKVEIDIVILDIIMKGINGIEVLEKIKSNSKLEDILVLMFTTLTDKRALQRCFNYGAKDFIKKPIEPIEFVSRVKSAIDERNYRMHLNENFNTIKKQNEELIELAKKLKETQYYLIQKEKLVALGQLAAGVAHEINNPLSYVSSNSETLQKYVSNLVKVFNEYKNLYSVINKNAFIENEINKIIELESDLNIDFILDDIDVLMKDSFDGIYRVKKIVESLKNFARKETKDNYQYYNVNEIIEEALILVKNEIKYIIDIDKKLMDLPDIKCNRTQIGQVLINICINAAQAIGKQDRNDKGKISITTETKDDYVICKISDDGPGIDENNLDEIFNPFFTTKDFGEGTGLGLSIAYDIIVNKHQGKLLVDSKIDEGTTFTIELPINLTTCGG